MDLGRGFKFPQGDQRCISNLLRQCTDYLYNGIVSKTATLFLLELREGHR